MIWDNDFLKAVWVFMVSGAGALLGFISRVNRELEGFTFKRKFFIFLFRTASSMFLAYLTYEAAVFIFESDDVAIAIAGFAAYFGTMFLSILQRKAPELFAKWLDKLVK